MKKILSLAIAAGVLATAGGSTAATLADFGLNGNLSNSAGGPVTLADNSGGGLGATGITFAPNGGPTLNNIGTLSAYTLETRFSLDTVGGYRKLVDFSNRTSDTGLYVQSGGLNFYGGGYGLFAVLPAGQLVTVTLTRDASKQVTGSVDGVTQFSFTDNLDLALIHDTLHLFRDDGVVGGEASGGFVDYVRLADASGFTDTGAPGVPEPATWAMMLLGFGGLGVSIRLRRRAVAA